MPRTRTRKETRPERTRVSGHRDILSVPQKKGYVRRWVNDEPGRIEMFKDAGWAIVEDPDIKVGDDAVERNNQALGTGARKYVGNETTAILMEIKEKWYKEDQATKAAEIDAKEEAMRAQQREEGRYGEVEVQSR